MNFYCKAMAQHLFSTLPHGDYFNYFVQMYLLRSLPISDDGFLDKASLAERHLSKFKKSFQADIATAKIYEFGAGWDLIIPLRFYFAGIRSQTLVDIRNLTRLVLVNDALAKFSQRGMIAPINKIRDITDLSKLGINCLAPLDAKNTGFPADDFDFISNSSTLEHIPFKDLSSIFKECYRILKPKCRMSCWIDMRDHFSFVDKKVNYYNFLKYSDRRWRLLNPSLAYQNRLRYSDYVRLFQNAGFKIESEDVKWPNEHDQGMLEKMKIDQRFCNFSLQDLGAKSMLIELCKA